MGGCKGCDRDVWGESGLDLVYAVGGHGWGGVGVYEEDADFLPVAVGCRGAIGFGHGRLVASYNKDILGLPDGSMENVGLEQFSQDFCWTVRSVFEGMGTAVVTTR